MNVSRALFSDYRPLLSVLWVYFDAVNQNVLLDVLAQYMAITHTLSFSLAHTHTLSHSHTLSLSLKHTHAYIHTHARARTRTHIHTLSHTLSQTHVHSATHARARTHTRTHAHRMAASLVSNAIPCVRSCSCCESRTHTHTQKHTYKRTLRNKRTHSETHTHTHTRSHVCIYPKDLFADALSRTRALSLTRVFSRTCVCTCSLSILLTFCHTLSLKLSFSLCFLCTSSTHVQEPCIYILAYVNEPYIHTCSNIKELPDINITANIE